MRVTVELVKGERRCCCARGCLHATETVKQYVKAPIFTVTIDIGYAIGHAARPIQFDACEDHLTGLSEDFNLAVDTATRALLRFTPAEGR